MKMDFNNQEFTILAVDDTGIFLDIIENAVSHMGKFIRAENGEIALVKAREYKPDIILLDIELPDINGLEVARQLKSNPMTNSATIIFITAHDQFSNELEAFLQGGVDFISKPINNELIQARVRTHLSLINKTRQLRKAHDELAKFVARRNIFISYWSYDLINIYNNDVDGKWFDKTANDIVGHSLIPLFNNSDGNAFAAAINKNLVKKAGAFEFSFTNYQNRSKRVHVSLIDERAFENQDGFLMIMTEIDDDNTSGQEWQLEKSKFTESLTAVVDGVITTDTMGRITYANSAAERLIGLSSDELLLQNIDTAINLIDKNTNERLVSPVNYALSERCKTNPYADSMLVSKNGRRYEIEDSASPVFDENSELIGSVLVFRDVTQKRENEQRIFHLSNHDALTGLPNRTLLMDRGSQAIKDAHRNNCAVAMLMINIDRFQQVNDKHGYVVGDKVLQRVAKLLGLILRAYDTISRQGGDEFVVILPTISDDVNIAEFCTRIKSDFAQRWKTKEFAFDLTLCIGVSMYPVDCDDVHQLYQKAHTAMHEAKRIGKDSISFFSKELELKAKQQQQQIAKLQEAIKSDEIILFYQPKVDAKTSEILGFEALARWPQKDGGMIFPDAFIPLAEETKLIISLGESLLKQACAQTVEWQKQYPKLHVSVNVSAVQFTSQLIETVSKVIVDTGIAPECLELEITESVLLNDDHSLTTFNELKKLGIKISIDDFGTGYSSLSYIKKYALDVLKIDQSFVRNMFEEKIDITIIQTIITLANNLEINLIAEGVETKRHADLLKELGCDILQGYYFGRPVSKEDTSRILATSRFIKP